MIQFGNDEIKEIYVGSDKVKEVYHGSDLVWSGKPPTPSYAILTNDTRVDFEMDNTPITNFANAASSVVINGSTITKTTIKELVFGDSYKNVTSIGAEFLYKCSSLTSLDLSVFSNVTSISDFFLYYCTALTSLDLSAFSNVTSIGANFLRDCSALTSLDLSAFSKVTSIGNYFLRYCSKLTQFKIGAVNVPTTSASGFLGSTTALTTILVPMQSVQDYKTTAPWSGHASKITGY